MVKTAAISVGMSFLRFALARARCKKKTYPPILSMTAELLATGASKAASSSWVNQLGRIKYRKGINRMLFTKQSVR